MKTSLKSALILAAVTLVPAMAQASVVINLQGGALTGGTAQHNPLAANSTVVLLADADNNGNFNSLSQIITALSQSPDSFALPGDKVIARFGTNNFGDAGPGSFAVGIGSGDPGFPAFILDSLPAGVQAGEALLLVWYNTPYNAVATGPGSGVEFGAYRTTEVKDFSDISWVVPNDGANVNLNFITAVGGGQSADSAGFATAVTVGGAAVPEPASLGVLALGGTLLMARRRRSSKA